jgi:hypothetical protein
MNELISQDAGPDAERHASPPKTKRYTNLAAAAGGVGVSTALFTTVGIAKILMSPDTHTAEYAIMVFCCVALFVVATTMMLRTETSGNRIFGFLALGFFGFVAIACLASIITNSHYSPVVVLTERVQPDMSSFRDPDSSQPVRLTLMHYLPGQTSMVPFKDGTHRFKNDDVIEIFFGGVSELAEKYKLSIRQRQILEKELEFACKNAKSKDICAMTMGTMEAHL